ncbi:hypothetical protein CA11_40370 [Gimesia maris]|uniref:DUF2304 domain-containing protein n=1 Tax=Gimesia maris TaxID=122 RepID=UPI00118BDC33|nr:DUF2304 domain-containing protein [Gimesia maris]QDU16208.1 hypothetical protein CA11_40370 [Gimesia maris]
MNLFQWLIVPLLVCLMAWELRAFIQRRQQLRLARFVVWLMAAVLILYPDLASVLAHTLGIGRGTDLVLYAFMLCTICVLFHLYGKQFVLSRNLVELARREALRTAVAGRGLDRKSVHSASELKDQRTGGSEA